MEKQRKSYAVIIRREFYGPETTVGLATPENGSMGVLEFDSPRAAREWIAERDGEVYHLAHNEAVRPSYRVTTVGSARFCEAYRRTFGGMEWQG